MRLVMPGILALLLAAPSSAFSEDLVRTFNASDEAVLLPVQWWNAPYRSDPCTNGRISDGRPRSCSELRRWLRERGDDDWREEYPRADRQPAPCTDGRISDGHPHTCEEIMRELRRRY